MKTANDYVMDAGGIGELDAGTIDQAIRDTLEAAASFIEAKRDKACPEPHSFCDNFGCGSLTELADRIRSGKL